MKCSLRRWWSMTMTRWMRSSSAGAATRCGMCVSTTTSTGLSAVMLTRSLARTMMSWYSSLSLRISENLPMPSFMSDSTILTGLPSWRAILATPIEAPKQSKSSLWWPMTKTASAPSMISRMAWATTRALTRVCFSTAFARPPKNCVLPPICTATWSPPRPSARSSPAWACVPRSAMLWQSATATPIDSVTGRRFALCSWRTLSRMSKRAAMALSSALRSRMTT